MTKCILILSNKSSGSSALQRLLAQAVSLKSIEKTRHFQNESLYWTKAASVLNLPQQTMLDSEVPIAAAAARQDLIRLLRDNVSDYKLIAGTATEDDREWVFDGWRQLCQQYQPIFLEKSPHHLLQWSALQLIVDCMTRLEGEVDFLLVGLVRNPMDTLHSAFRRWKTPPEKLQYEWLRAYTHLQQLAEQLGPKVVIVRYEDLASSLDPLIPVFDFCGTSPGPAAECLNRQSLMKWRQDAYFGFELAPEVRALAQSYGYSDAALANSPRRLWPLYRDGMRQLYLSLRWAKRLYLQINPPA
ncbi:MAG: sulfotransferase [Phormidesmis sp.]